MKKLTPEFVKETIQRLDKDRFTFAELSAGVPADYDSLKNMVFRLLAEAKPCLKQIFDTEAREIRLQRSKT